MSLEKPTATDTRNESNAKKYLNELAKSLSNSSNDFGAKGNVEISLLQPDDNDEWSVQVSGSISKGQDSDGKEMWGKPNLDEFYYGKSLQEVLKRIFKDVSQYYG
ncbi:MAG: hypothetical protein KJ970_07505 [Candidatus Eisenbacteria bacterium]|uniref:Uncharacterized protein n=1 Tax=Eiseniibacteriota bacterium TaxID=2212470 RepID=A0A948W658_UNCEI|nr:hypothetical protein [Candidatus Eisenbacteria bacterium]MBU1949387.1 hypothetical protein [Candidatus Eisenbacteria bacterium]MBU2690760.1 hypothetical protein [Candidatus Eisenbacteria bacterium]